MSTINFMALFRMYGGILSCRLSKNSFNWLRISAWKILRFFTGNCKDSPVALPVIYAFWRDFFFLLFRFPTFQSIGVLWWFLKCLEQTLRQNDCPYWQPRILSTDAKHLFVARNDSKSVQFHVYVHWKWRWRKIRLKALRAQPNPMNWHWQSFLNLDRTNSENSQYYCFDKERCDDYKTNFNIHSDFQRKNKILHFFDEFNC